MAATTRSATSTLGADSFVFASGDGRDVVHGLEVTEQRRVSHGIDTDDLTAKKCGARGLTRGCGAGDSVYLAGIMADDKTAIAGLREQTGLQKARLKPDCFCRLTVLTNSVRFHLCQPDASTHRSQHSKVWPR